MVVYCSALDLLVKVIEHLITQNCNKKVAAEWWVIYLIV